MNLKNNEGVTLIALIITVIIMLILAGVALSVLTGNEGLFKKVTDATGKAEDAKIKEEKYIGEMIELVHNAELEGEWNDEKNVNSPKISKGMIPVKYLNGRKWVICSQDDIEWYNYGNKKWANVMLGDGKYDVTAQVGTEVDVDELGSMFVWIPRFAYKIKSNYHSNLAGEIEVKFLKGVTNTTIDNAVIVDYNATTTNNFTQFPDGYVVHPAFTNNVNIGGWNRNLTGIWVSKFEAGYPMADTEDDVTLKTSDDMYYPVFKGKRYAYNNYTVEMLYKVCEAMNSNSNPYSITANSNSHMIKNSEWGAAVYLAKSSYGNGSEIYINNVRFSSDKTNINGTAACGLTGYSADMASRDVNRVAVTERADSLTGASYTSYVWYTLNGIHASTTGNITGIFDMSGGCLESTACVINSGHENIENYGGRTFSSLNESNKKITLYSAGNSNLSETDISRSYSAWNSMYGDAIWEISSQVGENHGWNEDRIDEDNDVTDPFFIRGGDWGMASLSGGFSLGDHTGDAFRSCSTRAVLIVE